MKPVVGIIMGSDSDLPVMSKAAEILDQLQVPYELTVVSAHRTPDKMYEYEHTAKEERTEGYHCGSRWSSTSSGNDSSHDSITSYWCTSSDKSFGGGLIPFTPFVRCRQGFRWPRLINGALNAGLLAAKIVANEDDNLARRLMEYSKSMEMTVEAKAEKLMDIKYQEYLKEMKS